MKVFESHLIGSSIALLAISASVVASQPNARNEPACRYLPGDEGWPTEEQWNSLNDTTGGKLTRGKPLAQDCYDPAFDPDSEACLPIQAGFNLGSSYYEDPVNVMSPYWANNSCSPFEASDTGCSLGNLAEYALEVDGLDTVIAGLHFAKQHNIRLSIKNTGHDYLGRSAGRGSLALWTHNLKDISFLDYRSSYYTGAAAKIGAGVQFSESYAAAAERGLRVVGGWCPSVGLAGGYVQGGGHGPLASTYGLAADTTLEFEIVTVDGRHLTASPAENSDLYWALSGGGGGTYAVVLSVTMKAHQDGPTAGASLSFANTDPDAYWDAVAAFQSHLLVLDEIPGLATTWSFNADAFALNAATLPGGTELDIAMALAPFLEYLNGTGLAVATYATTIHPSFYSHFQDYTFPPEVFTTHNTMAGRLIPRSAVKNSLLELIAVFRQIAEDPSFSNKRISGNTLNVSPSRLPQPSNWNAVLPPWRDALYTMNILLSFSPGTSSEELKTIQQKANDWQDLVSAVTPGSGAYAGESTYDNLNWKEDYFGSNYGRLLEIKVKYDPEFLLWQHTIVGADEYWQVAEDGRLCRVP